MTLFEQMFLAAAHNLHRDMCIRFRMQHELTQQELYHYSKASQVIRLAKEIHQERERG